MPELPEVETTRGGIEPYVRGAAVRAVTVRERRLRWPVPESLERDLPGQVIREVIRRGKYLLLPPAAGTVLRHLGMSGSLRIAASGDPPEGHDRVDLALDNGRILRLRDPRKFGCVLWLTGPPLEHPLLAGLGPEPLGPEFGGEYLFRRSRKSAVSIKPFLMDGRIVAGIGNIYASEALFAAGIHPRRRAGGISAGRYEALAEAVKSTLAKAIAAGGTTLRDFVGGDGTPGYFSQSLNVYGRAGEPCVHCGRRLKEIRLGQRGTVYCGVCQR